MSLIVTFQAPSVTLITYVPVSVESAVHLVPSAEVAVTSTGSNPGIRLSQVVVLSTWYSEPVIM